MKIIMAGLMGDLASNKQHSGNRTSTYKILPDLQNVQLILYKLLWILLILGGLR